LPFLCPGGRVRGPEKGACTAEVKGRRKVVPIGGI